MERLPKTAQALRLPSPLAALARARAGLTRTAAAPRRPPRARASPARRLAPAVAALLVLGGCATFSADGGFEAVEQLTRERTGQSPARQKSTRDAAAAQERISELLALPLTAESAVEVALLGNPGLQASFQDLGIAESELVRAGRLRNPAFSFGRLSGGGGVEIERTVMFDVLGLIRMPLASRIEQRRFEQAKLRAASDAVGIAAQTRRAYFRAVAAQELVTYFEQVKDAADAASELARRMVEAGNFSKLAQMREQAFQAQVAAGLAGARHRAAAAREALIRSLGLAADQPGFELPGRLPGLPDQPAVPVDAERTAMAQRLDVMIARRATQAAADSLGLTKATRMVNVLELGYANASESGAERKDGYEVELELPLFDFGSTRAARAEAVYMQALHRAAQVAVDARSEVRENYSAYRAAYDLARQYRDEIVPLRKQISEENLLRYNGMLIGVFELLADAREQVASVAASVEALRDFWLAASDLQMAMTGRSPAPVAEAGTATTTATGVATAAGPGGH